MRNKLKIIIPITLVVIIAAIAAGIFLFVGKDKNNIEVSELQFGLEWGTDRAEVEKKLNEAGCEKENVLKDESGLKNPPLFYKINDFAGIEEADVRAMIMFDDGKLTTICYVANIKDEIEGTTGLSEDVVSDIKEKYEDALNDTFGKSISGEEMGYEEDSRYWMTDKTIISVSTSFNKLYIDYSHKNEYKKSDPGLVEMLEKLLS